MGIYEQGTSTGPPEPAMGHPMYPPVSEGASHDQGMPQLINPAPAVKVHPEGLNTEEWASTLCGNCGSEVCCQTCWCPCITFGQIAEILDEGRSSCSTQGAIYGLFCAVGIPCAYSFLWRQKLRMKFRLKRGDCGDFWTHCCCDLCALCQEYRELQIRGLDPSLGWEAARQNVVQQQQQPMAVPSPDVMRR